MSLLSEAEIASVRSLLERICIPSPSASQADKNDCVVGEILVANVQRSIAAEIHDVALVAKVLNHWATRLVALDAENAVAGYPTTVKEILTLTETEVYAVSPKPLHDLLTHPSYNTFKTPQPGKAYFHAKTLHATLEYLFYGAADAIGLSDNALPGTVNRTARLVEERLSRLQPHQMKSKRGAACLHNKQYFWATSLAHLESMLGTSINTPPHAEIWVGDRVAELLGLVHLTKPPTAITSGNHRFLVGITLASGYLREVTKSSFVFSDHNPRFAAWDDHLAMTNSDWGHGVDLAVFDGSRELRKGAVEAVAIVPGSLAHGDIGAMHALGKLTGTSWGADEQTCANNPMFASLLRGSASSRDIIELIIATLRNSAH